MTDRNDKGWISEPVRQARESLWGDGKRFLRICRSVPGEIIIAFLLYFLLQRILVPLIGSLVINAILVPLFGESLMAFITPVQAWCEIIMLTGFIAYMRFAERRSFPAMGFIQRKWLLWYLAGFGCGVALFLISILISTAVTGGSIACNGRISPLMFFVALTGFMVQGMAEEVDGRGYMFLSISRCHKEYTGVLASGIFFGIIHINNTGATFLSVLNTILWGVLFCLLLIVTENIWFVGALHAAWNFAQGNIFGVLVSGSDSGASIFQAQLSGDNALLTGGAYGIEGNVVTSVIVIAMIVTMMINIRRKKNNFKTIT